MRLHDADVRSQLQQKNASILLQALSTHAVDMHHSSSSEPFSQSSPAVSAAVFAEEKGNSRPASPARPLIRRSLINTADNISNLDILDPELQASTSTDGMQPALADTHQLVAVGQAQHTKSHKQTRGLGGTAYDEDTLLTEALLSKNISYQLPPTASNMSSKNQTFAQQTILAASGMQQSALLSAGTSTVPANSVVDEAPLTAAGGSFVYGAEAEVAEDVQAAIAAREVTLALVIQEAIALNRRFLAGDGSAVDLLTTLYPRLQQLRVDTLAYFEAYSAWQRIKRKRLAFDSNRGSSNGSKKVMAISSASLHTAPPSSFSSPSFAAAASHRTPRTFSAVIAYYAAGEPLYQASPGVVSQQHTQRFNRGFEPAKKKTTLQYIGEYAQREEAVTAAEEALRKIPEELWFAEDTKAVNPIIVSFRPCAKHYLVRTSGVPADMACELCRVHQDLQQAHSKHTEGQSLPFPWRAIDYNNKVQEDLVPLSELALFNHFGADHQSRPSSALVRGGVSSKSNNQPVNRIRLRHNPLLLDDHFLQNVLDIAPSNDKSSRSGHASETVESATKKSASLPAILRYLQDPLVQQQEHQRALTSLWSPVLMSSSLNTYSNPNDIAINSNITYLSQTTSATSAHHHTSNNSKGKKELLHDALIYARRQRQQEAEDARNLPYLSSPFHPNATAEQRQLLRQQDHQLREERKQQLQQHKVGTSSKKRPGGIEGVRWEVSRLQTALMALTVAAPPELLRRVLQSMDLAYDPHQLRADMLADMSKVEEGADHSNVTQYPADSSLMTLRQSHSAPGNFAPVASSTAAAATSSSSASLVSMSSTSFAALNRTHRIEKRDLDKRELVETHLLDKGGTLSLLQERIPPAHRTDDTFCRTDKGSEFHGLRKGRAVRSYDFHDDLLLQGKQKEVQRRHLQQKMRRAIQEAQTNIVACDVALLKDLIAQAQQIRGSLLQLEVAQAQQCIEKRRETLESTALLQRQFRGYTARTLFQEKRAAYLLAQHKARLTAQFSIMFAQEVAKDVLERGRQREGVRREGRWGGRVHCVVNLSGILAVVTVTRARRHERQPVHTLCNSCALVGKTSSIPRNNAEEVIIVDPDQACSTAQQSDRRSEQPIAQPKHSIPRERYQMLRAMIQQRNEEELQEQNAKHQKLPRYAQSTHKTENTSLLRSQKSTRTSALASTSDPLAFNVSKKNKADQNEKEVRPKVRTSCTCLVVREMEKWRVRIHFPLSCREEVHEVGTEEVLRVLADLQRALEGYRQIDEQDNVLLRQAFQPLLTLPSPSPININSSPASSSQQVPSRIESNDRSYEEEEDDEEERRLVSDARGERSYVRASLRAAEESAPALRLLRAPPLPLPLNKLLSGPQSSMATDQVANMDYYGLKSYADDIAVVSPHLPSDSKRGHRVLSTFHALEMRDTDTAFGPTRPLKGPGQGSDWQPFDALDRAKVALSTAEHSLSILVRQEADARTALHTAQCDLTVQREMYETAQMTHADACGHWQRLQERFEIETALNRQVMERSRLYASTIAAQEAQELEDNHPAYDTTQEESSSLWKRMHRQKDAQTAVERSVPLVHSTAKDLISAQQSLLKAQKDLLWTEREVQRLRRDTALAHRDVENCQRLWKGVQAELKSSARRFAQSFSFPRRLGGEPQGAFPGGQGSGARVWQVVPHQLVQVRDPVTRLKVQNRRLLSGLCRAVVDMMVSPDQRHLLPRAPWKQTARAMDSDHATSETNLTIDSAAEQLEEEVRVRSLVSCFFDSQNQTFVLHFGLSSVSGIATGVSEEIVRVEESMLHVDLQLDSSAFSALVPVTQLCEIALTFEEAKQLLEHQRQHEAVHRKLHLRQLQNPTRSTEHTEVQSQFQPTSKKKVPAIGSTDVSMVLVVDPSGSLHHESSEATLLGVDSSETRQAYLKSNADSQTATLLRTFDQSSAIRCRPATQAQLQQQQLESLLANEEDSVSSTMAPELNNNYLHRFQRRETQPVLLAQRLLDLLRLHPSTLRPTLGQLAHMRRQRTAERLFLAPDSSSRWLRDLQAQQNGAFATAYNSVSSRGCSSVTAVEPSMRCVVTLHDQRLLCTISRHLGTFEVQLIPLHVPSVTNAKQMFIQSVTRLRISVAQILRRLVSSGSISTKASEGMKMTSSASVFHIWAWSQMLRVDRVTVSRVFEEVLGCIVGQLPGPQGLSVHRRALNSEQPTLHLLSPPLPLPNPVAFIPSAMSSSSNVSTSPPTADAEPSTFADSSRDDGFQRLSSCHRFVSGRYCLCVLSRRTSLVAAGLSRAGAGDAGVGQVLRISLYPPAASHRNYFPHHQLSAASPIIHITLSSADIPALLLRQMQGHFHGQLSALKLQQQQEMQQRYQYGSAPTSAAATGRPSGMLTRAGSFLRPLSGLSALNSARGGGGLASGGVSTVASGDESDGPPVSHQLTLRPSSASHHNNHARNRIHKRAGRAQQLLQRMAQREGVAQQVAHAMRLLHEHHLLDLLNHLLDCLVLPPHLLAPNTEDSISPSHKLSTETVSLAKPKGPNNQTLRNPPRTPETGSLPPLSNRRTLQRPMTASSGRTVSSAAATAVSGRSAASGLITEPGSLLLVEPGGLSLQPGDLSNSVLKSQRLRLDHLGHLGYLQESAYKRAYDDDDVLLLSAHTLQDKGSRGDPFLRDETAEEEVAAGIVDEDEDEALQYGLQVDLRALHQLALQAVRQQLVWIMNRCGEQRHVVGEDSLHTLRYTLQQLVGNDPETEFMDEDEQTTKQEQTSHGFSHLKTKSNGSTAVGKPQRRQVRHLEGIEVLSVSTAPSMPPLSIAMMATISSSVSVLTPAMSRSSLPLMHSNMQPLTKASSFSASFRVRPPFAHQTSSQVKTQVRAPPQLHRHAYMPFKSTDQETPYTVIALHERRKQPSLPPHPLHPALHILSTYFQQQQRGSSRSQGQELTLHTVLWAFPRHAHRIPDSELQLLVNSRGQHKRRLPRSLSISSNDEVEEEVVEEESLLCRVTIATPPAFQQLRVQVAIATSEEVALGIATQELLKMRHEDVWSNALRVFHRDVIQQSLPVEKTTGIEEENKDTCVNVREPTDLLAAMRAKLPSQFPRTRRQERLDASAGSSSVFFVPFSQHLVRLIRQLSRVQSTSDQQASSCEDLLDSISDDMFFTGNFSTSATTAEGMHIRLSTSEPSYKSPSDSQKTQTRRPRRYVPPNHQESAVSGLLGFRDQSIWQRGHLPLSRPFSSAQVSRHPSLDQSPKMLRETKLRDWHFEWVSSSAVLLSLHIPTSKLGGTRGFVGGSLMDNHTESRHWCLHSITLHLTVKNVNSSSTNHIPVDSGPSGLCNAQLRLIDTSSQQECSLSLQFPIHFTMRPAADIRESDEPPKVSSFPSPSWTDIHQQATHTLSAAFQSGHLFQSIQRVFREIATAQQRRRDYLQRAVLEVVHDVVHSVVDQEVREGVAQAVVAKVVLEVENQEVAAVAQEAHSEETALMIQLAQELELAAAAAEMEGRGEGGHEVVVPNVLTKSVPEPVAALSRAVTRETPPEEMALETETRSEQAPAVVASANVDNAAVQVTQISDQYSETMVSMALTEPSPKPNGYVATLSFDPATSTAFDVRSNQWTSEVTTISSAVHVVASEEAFTDDYDVSLMLSLHVRTFPKLPAKAKQMHIMQHTPQLVTEAPLEVKTDPSDMLHNAQDTMQRPESLLNRFGGRKTAIVPLFRAPRTVPPAVPISISVDEAANNNNESLATSKPSASQNNNARSTERARRQTTRAARKQQKLLSKQQQPQGLLDDMQINKVPDEDWLNKDKVLIVYLPNNVTEEPVISFCAPLNMHKHLQQLLVQGTVPTGDRVEDVVMERDILQTVFLYRLADPLVNSNHLPSSSSGQAKISEPTENLRMRCLLELLDESSQLDPSSLSRILHDSRDCILVPRHYSGPTPDQTLLGSDLNSLKNRSSSNDYGSYASARKRAEDTQSYSQNSHSHSQSDSRHTPVSSAVVSSAVVSSSVVPNTQLVSLLPDRAVHTSRSNHTADASTAVSGVASTADTTSLPTAAIAMETVGHQATQRVLLAVHQAQESLQEQMRHLRHFQGRALERWMFCQRLLRMVADVAADVLVDSLAVLCDPSLLTAYQHAVMKSIADGDRDDLDRSKGKQESKNKMTDAFRYRLAVQVLQMSDNYLSAVQQLQGPRSKASGLSLEDHVHDVEHVFHLVDDLSPYSSSSLDDHAKEVLKTIEKAFARTEDPSQLELVAEDVDRVQILPSATLRILQRSLYRYRDEQEVRVFEEADVRALKDIDILYNVRAPVDDGEADLDDADSFNRYQRPQNAPETRDLRAHESRWLLCLLHPLQILVLAIARHASECAVAQSSCRFVGCAACRDLYRVSFRGDAEIVMASDESAASEINRLKRWQTVAQDWLLSFCRPCDSSKPSAARRSVRRLLPSNFFHPFGSSMAMTRPLASIYREVRSEEHAVYLVHRSLQQQQYLQTTYRATRVQTQVILALAALCSPHLLSHPSAHKSGVALQMEVARQGVQRLRVQGGRFGLRAMQQLRVLLTCLYKLDCQEQRQEMNAAQQQKDGETDEVRKMWQRLRQVFRLVPPASSSSLHPALGHQHPNLRHGHLHSAPGSRPMSHRPHHPLGNEQHALASNKTPYHHPLQRASTFNTLNTLNTWNTVQTGHGSSDHGYGPSSTAAVVTTPSLAPASAAAAESASAALRAPPLALPGATGEVEDEAADQHRGGRRSAQRPSVRASTTQRYETPRIELSFDVPADPRAQTADADAAAVDPTATASKTAAGATSKDSVLDASSDQVQIAHLIALLGLSPVSTTSDTSPSSALSSATPPAASESASTPHRSPSLSSDRNAVGEGQHPSGQKSELSEVEEVSVFGRDVIYGQNAFPTQSLLPVLRLARLLPPVPSTASVPVAVSAAPDDAASTAARAAADSLGGSQQRTSQRTVDGRGGDEGVVEAEEEEDDVEVSTLRRLQRLAPRALLCALPRPPPRAPPYGEGDHDEDDSAFDQEEASREGVARGGRRPGEGGAKEESVVVDRDEADEEEDGSSVDSSSVLLPSASSALVTRLSCTLAMDRLLFEGVFSLHTDHTDHANTNNNLLIAQIFFGTFSRTSSVAISTADTSSSVMGSVSAASTRYLPLSLWTQLSRGITLQVYEVSSRYHSQALALDEATLRRLLSSPLASASPSEGVWGLCQFRSAAQRLFVLLPKLVQCQFVQAQCVGVRLRRNAWTSELPGQEEHSEVAGEAVEEMLSKEVLFPRVQGMKQGMDGEVLGDVVYRRSETYSVRSTLPAHWNHLQSFLQTLDQKV